MKKSYFQKILVLPDAGPENPFQYQMIDFLVAQGLSVYLGKKQKLGGIYKNLRAVNPDVVYFDWVHSFIIGKNRMRTFLKSFVFVLEVIYLRNWKQIPIIHTLHNIRNHADIDVEWEQIIYGFFLRRCTKIRVYSEAVKREVSVIFKISTHQIQVIQDLPYHYFYPNQSTRKDSRKYLNIHVNQFVFLFFGKIRPYKGLEDLIGIFQLSKMTNQKLVVAGECLDHKYLSKIKKLVAAYPSIYFHDRFIEKHEVQYFFNAADVVVLPFTRIDHSGTVSLAMSFGKPAITLKTESSGELLQHQNTLLFDRKEDLAECMATAHKLDLKEIGQQNFALADANNYRELLTLFEIIVDK